MTANDSQAPPVNAIDTPGFDAITIAGSGAVGSLFAAFLEPHAPVRMLSHWPAQIDAVGEQGLICLHRDGTSSRHAFMVTDRARALQPVKLALVLVKSYQTARAALELSSILAADGLAITLQNGLGNFELLEKRLGFGRVAQGVSAQGATMLGPGKVKHAGQGPTHIAAVPGRGLLIDRLVDLFNRAGLPCAVSRDVRSLQWGKLAVNAGINPLTALLRVRNGFLVEDDAAREIMCAAAAECAAVAGALGVALPYEDACAQASQVAAATGGNYSSMLQDVLRGAPTEIDAISGAIASHGREVGLPTPVNEALWHRVRALRPDQQTGERAGRRDAIIREILEGLG